MFSRNSRKIGTVIVTTSLDLKPRLYVFTRTYEILKSSLYNAVI